ncbi:hypothetical protein AB69_5043 [Escherichia coli 1-110-08_S1_C3]|nr:hypothetical protein AB69_5043 [Escherichia coli 1-110-08_S1_C3]
MILNIGALFLLLNKMRMVFQMGGGDLQEQLHYESLMC